MKAEHTLTSWSDADRAALSQALAELDAAEAGGMPHAMAGALSRLARCYRGAGEPEIAAQCLRQGVRWAALIGCADSQLDLLCELAEASVDASEGAGLSAPRQRSLREQARDHGFEASRLAPRAADPQWEVAVLLRVSDVLDRCGDHDDAIALQCRAMALIVRVEQAGADSAPEFSDTVRLN